MGNVPMLGRVVDGMWRRLDAKAISKPMTGRSQWPGDHPLSATASIDESE